MKFQLRNLILLTILASVSCITAQAAGKNLEILSDTQMAAVEGGFCLFETCETGQPSGNCQPRPPTFNALCPARTCRYISIPLLYGGEVDVCTLLGRSTCTETGDYRKCITGKLWDVCWNSSDNVCGDLVTPFCTDNVQETTCDCNVAFTDYPCNWTDCLLESQ